MNWVKHLEFINSLPISHFSILVLDALVPRHDFLGLMQINHEAKLGGLQDMILCNAVWESFIISYPLTSSKVEDERISSLHMNLLICSRGLERHCDCNKLQKQAGTFSTGWSLPLSNVAHLNNDAVHTMDEKQSRIHPAIGNRHPLCTICH